MFKQLGAFGTRTGYEGIQWQPKPSDRVANLPLQLVSLGLIKSFGIEFNRPCDGVIGSKSFPWRTLVLVLWHAAPRYQSIK